MKDRDARAISDAVYRLIDAMTYPTRLVRLEGVESQVSREGYARIALREALERAY